MGTMLIWASGVGAILVGILILTGGARKIMTILQTLAIANFGLSAIGAKIGRGNDKDRIVGSHARLAHRSLRRVRTAEEQMANMAEKGPSRELAYMILNEWAVDAQEALVRTESILDKPAVFNAASLIAEIAIPIQLGGVIETVRNNAGIFDKAASLLKGDKLEKVAADHIAYARRMLLRVKAAEERLGEGAEVEYALIERFLIEMASDAIDAINEAGGYDENDPIDAAEIINRVGAEVAAIAEAQGRLQGTQGLR